MINNTLHRNAFLLRQGLENKPPWHTVQEAVRQIAAVQIDTISVVARSHHLTLRHRIHDYKPEQLWTALRQHEVFEHFAHACCFVPIEEYPYYRHRMERFPTHGNDWEKRLLKKYKNLMPIIYKRIKDEGPLSSQHFVDSSGKKRGGFWDWKPAKRALDLLWQTGQLAVAERVGFQRVYDITERVIPSKYLNQHIEQEEVWRHFVQRSLDCLVVGTAKDVIEYISFGNYALERKGTRVRTIEEKLQKLEQEDIVMKVEIPNATRQHYILTRNLPFIQQVQERQSPMSRVWFLNPFDNILWNRSRVKRLFGVEVKLEAYIPAAQRQFGYYITPILWQNHIIGRIDPKADRETSTLILRNIEINVPKKEISKILNPIRAELERFKTFHDLEYLDIEKAKPTILKAVLLAS